MALANLADKVLLWIHGRRLGLTGDGQSTGNAALVMDGVPVATTRAPILKAVTGGSGAGAVTLAGTVVGDNVVSVTDITSAADVSSSFESTISVAGQIQQTATVSGHVVLVAVQPQS